MNDLVERIIIPDSISDCGGTRMFMEYDVQPILEPFYIPVHIPTIKDYTKLEIGIEIIKMISLIAFIFGIIFLVFFSWVGFCYLLTLN